MLFPQLKRGLPAPNLAVRQEHLALLRQLVLAFPAHYAELAVLTGGQAGCVRGEQPWPALRMRSLALHTQATRLQTKVHAPAAPTDGTLSAAPAAPAALRCAAADPDAEVDFLLNVAHIQLHRRARCGGWQLR